jgi:hypothetical protein
LRWRNLIPSVNNLTHWGLALTFWREKIGAASGSLWTKSKDIADGQPHLLLFAVAT